MDLTALIRDIPDFPKPGVLFKDITPLLADPGAFSYAVAKLAAHYAARPLDAVAAAEARGFLLAAACKLIEKAGGTVAGCAFLIELGFLNGRAPLAGYDVFSLISY